MILEKNKWVVPEKPNVSVPQRRDMYILGQRTNQVLELDIKANEHKEDIYTKARGTWKNAMRRDLEVYTQACSSLMHQNLSFLLE